MSPARQKPDLQKKLHDVPHTPGVYVMRDRLNRVIYVGKARDLRKRLSNYFMPSRARQADIKTRALIDSIWDFDIHQVRHDSEALILEMRLIKDFRPKYNVSFRDDKRYLLVKVQMADPFPRFTLTRMKKDDGARYFGPFAHSSALRTTLDWMNRQFRPARLPPAGARRNRFQALPQRHHQELFRSLRGPHQPGGISRPRRAGLRIPGRQIARPRHRPGGRDGKGLRPP